MKIIYLYTGTGAYQAKDIENFLAVFDFDYRRLHESEFSELKPGGIFIVPGGKIKSYLPAWGETGVEAIRKFVSDGGTYIGICSGTYIAGKNFEGTAGLNFFENELKYIKSQEVVKVKDNFGNSWQLISENGPDLSEIKSDLVILKDRNGKPQAVKINFGKGQVYLFASHPEGSVYHKQHPQNFSGAEFFNNFLRTL